MVFSGTSPDGRLIEMVEIPANDFFIACQFHPEFYLVRIDLSLYLRRLLRQLINIKINNVTKHI